MEHALWRRGCAWLGKGRRRGERWGTRVAGGSGLGDSMRRRAAQRLEERQNHHLRHAKRSYGVMVSTQDSESCDPGSIPGMNSFGMNSLAGDRFAAFVGSSPLCLFLSVPFFELSRRNPSGVRCLLLLAPIIIMGSGRRRRR